LRLLALMVLEVVLGAAWGLVWSVYSRVLVDSGFEGFRYGVLGLAMSASILASYAASSLAYYAGLSRLVMPVSATFLGLGYYALSVGRFVEAAPIALGFALGGHTVSTIRASSYLSSGNPRLIALVYSSSLLGFSLGSLAVARGYEVNPLYVVIVVLLAGIAYQWVQGSLRLNPYWQRLLHDLALAVKSGRSFIVTSTILGLAGGLTLYNMDYFLITVYNSGEDKVALMLALSGLGAILASLTTWRLVDGDSWSAYAKLVLAQAIIIALIPVVSGELQVIALYVVGKALATISDALFDSMYTSIPPRSLAELRILIVIASWELSSGVGKMLASIALDISQVAPILAGSTLMLAFSTLILLAGKARSNPNMSRAIPFPQSRALHNEEHRDSRNMSTASYKGYPGIKSREPKGKPGQQPPLEPQIHPPHRFKV